MIPVPGSQLSSPLRPWYDWRQEIGEQRLKSMANEYRSITGGEGESMWQQRELSWSLASLWLMPCLTARGDRDSLNASQTIVWRLHFHQPQSPNLLHPLAALRGDASQLTNAVMRPLIVLPWWLISNSDRVKACCAVWNNQGFLGALWLPWVWLTHHSYHMSPVHRHITDKPNNTLYFWPHQLNHESDSGSEKPRSAV